MRLGEVSFGFLVGRFAITYWWLVVVAEVSVVHVQLNGKINRVQYHARVVVGDLFSTLQTL
jgi:hypothetical protein